MKNFVNFIEQISKYVLPYYYVNIINNSYVKLFRFIACIAIIVLFIFKSLLGYYWMYFLLAISYSYMLYQCIIVIIKIYYIRGVIITNNTKRIWGKIPLPHIKITYYLIGLIVVFTGLLIISDTRLEIIGEVKYVIK
jgi:hypothetical protein